MNAVCRHLAVLDCADGEIITAGDTVPASPDSGTGSPAFLVYYSPAFLRNLARDAALGALRILAIGYRHARKLWPASDAHEGNGVTIYVDALKACADMKAVVESYMRGEFWVLVMKSETEGAVEKRALSEMPASKDADWSEWAKLGFEVLPLWGVQGVQDGSWERVLLHLRRKTGTGCFCHRLQNAYRSNRTGPGNAFRCSEHTAGQASCVQVVQVAVGCKMRLKTH